MFYSDSAKAVFVAIPKTGTRSMYDVLRTKFAGNLFKEHHPVIPDHLKKYFSFCTMRNPYDRAASAWWSTSCRGLDKRRFVADVEKQGWDNNLTSFLRIVKQRTAMGTRITRPQISFTKENRIDAILRFDHLEEDFNKLPFVKSPIEFPTLNTTTIQGPNSKVKPSWEALNNRPSWEELITDEGIALVNELYVDDFKALNLDMIK